MIIGFIYDILFFLPLALTACVMAKPRFADEVSMPAFVAVTVILALYFLFIKRSKLRERLMAVGLAATFLFASLLFFEKGTRLEHLLSYIWVAHILVITLLCLLVRVFAIRSFVARTALAAAGVLILPLSLIMNFEIGALSVILIFFYALITFVDELQRRSNKEGDPSLQKHLVFTCPFLIGVFIIAAIPKIPSNPYGWGFVHKISDSLQNGAAYASRFFSGTGWDSSSPFIGFSDDGRFGGNLVGSGYTVLELTSTASNDPYLYLAGKVYDTFDGRVWSGDEIDETSRYFDSVESASAALDCIDEKLWSDTDSVRDYVRPVTLTVNKNRTGTDRMFAPSKLIPSSESTKIREGITYLRLNTGTEELMQLFENGHEINDKSWRKAAEMTGLGDKPAYDISHFYDHVDAIRSRYLPETDISKRAKEYRDNIISGCAGDYEKLTKLESTLASGRYTDSPGDLPDSLSSASDYLDYFLFEKKEGYCSYYASAFVILARSCGIPSRLVQGYRTSAGDVLHIKVLSTDAHAWAECYIEGIGWVLFDPTPGMKSPSGSSGWMTHAEAADYYSSHYGNTPGEDGTSFLPDDKAKEKPSFSFMKFLIPILCGIAFTLILLGTDAIIRKIRYDRSQDREKALRMCEKSMQLLKRKGFVRKKEETLSEFRSRLAASVRPEYLDFIDSYERILYSSAPVTETDVETLEKSCLRLRHSRRKNNIVRNA